MFTSLILVAALPAIGTPEPGARIAVLDLPTPGLVGEQAEALADNVVNAIVTETTRLGYSVISSADINALLSLEKQKDMVGCEDNASCLAEIGGALGVDWLLTGALGKLGDGFTLTLTLVDTRRGEAASRFQESSGSESVLGDTARRGVAVIFGRAEDLSGVGMVVVRTDPEGGMVELDGKPAGVAPLTLDDVKAGDHVVTASRGDLKGSAKVHLVTGKVERLLVALKPGAPVKLKVLSMPPDAAVFIDGKEVGVTPLVVDEVAAGERRVRVALSGYYPVEEKVRLSREEFEKGGMAPVKVEVTLEARHTLLPFEIGLLLGGALDAARASKAVALDAEIFAEVVERFEIGVGLTNPPAYFASLRYWVWRGALEAAPVIRAVVYPVQVTGDRMLPAVALGLSVAKAFDVHYGHAGVRLDALVSVDPGGAGDPGVGVPVTLAFFWRM